MKQHITKEQWCEISEKQREIFWGFSIHNLSWKNNYEMVTIGQMIKFLGDGLIKIFGGRRVLYRIRAGELKEYNKLQLKDNLWEACKEKLNN